MRFSRSIHRLREEAGSACSSGPSASGVKTQAGGSSIGSCRTTGKDQLASRQLDRAGQRARINWRRASAWARMIGREDGMFMFLSKKLKREQATPLNEAKRALVEKKFEILGRRASDSL